MNTTTAFKGPPNNLTHIEIKWESVVAMFHSSFRDTFARSKKAHFDFLPPELRVIDGARDRWYPLLLLDAAWGLLWSNDYTFASKKAFNQRKVLYESIIEAIKRTEYFPLSENNLLFSVELLSAFDWQTNSNNVSFATDDQSTYQKKQQLNVVTKDIVAFQRAEDAENLFPQLITTFLSSEGVQISSHSHFPYYGSSSHHDGRRISQDQEKNISHFRQHLNYMKRERMPITNRTCFSFPSPFNVDDPHQANNPLSPSVASVFCSSFSQISSMNMCPASKDFQDDRLSPWMTLAGFKRLALSDPPAKSRSRFEAAVTYLTDIVTADDMDAHEQQIPITSERRQDMDIGQRELGELLHLVVCKVLLHQYCLYHESSAVDERSRHGFVGHDSHSVYNHNHYDNCGEGHRSSDDVCVWSSVAMEETLLDDWQHMNNCTPAVNMAYSSPSDMQWTESNNHQHSKLKRTRDEFMLSPTYQCDNDASQQSDSEQEASLEYPTRKRRCILNLESLRNPNITNDLNELQMERDFNEIDITNDMSTSIPFEQLQDCCSLIDYLPEGDDEDSFELFELLSTPSSRS